MVEKPNRKKEAGRELKLPGCDKKTNKVVVKLGQITPGLTKLVMDTRAVFEPGVSKNLKEERKWRVTDYVELAKAFLSSHILAFSQSIEYNNLKAISLSKKGNTYYFKIKKYLTNDKIAGKPLHIGERMNGYFVMTKNIEEKDPVMGFVEELKKNTIVSHLTSRVLLLKGLGDYTYLFMHFLIRKEEKDGNPALVRLTLQEQGPRMELKLQKVEKGVCSGDVVFHSYIQKTKTEIDEKRANANRLQKEKLKRKLEQEENVIRKKAASAKQRSEKKQGTEEVKAHSSD